MTKLSRQAGFTLLELFVALAIGMFLFAGVMSVFVGLRTTTQETSSFGELQENGRFAISILTEDLMRVGFWGDLSGDLNAAIVQNLNNVSVGDDCVGQGLNNGTFPGAVGHFRAIWGQRAIANSPFGCAAVNQVKVGTDVLQIKRAMAAPTTVANLDGGRFYLMTNGSYGAVFAGNVSAANRPVVPNSQIWEYQHHIYFIENETRGNNTVPVLNRAYLHIPGDSGTSGSFSAPHQLVEGVEDMRILYGVDNNDDGVVDLYLPESTMTQVQWDQEANVKLISAQVFLLIREIEPDGNYTNTNTYQLGDRQVAVNDNYRRLVYSSTVTMHNARVDVWQ